MRIYIAFALEDRDTAVRLSELLEERGITVICIGIGGGGPAPAVEFRDWVKETIQECDWAVVLWSANSRDSERVRAAALLARSFDKLFPVSLDGAGSSGPI